MSYHREPVALALNAMGTRFEFLLHGADARALRAIGEEALREVQSIEAQMSLYLPSSEIYLLNSRAGRQPIRVAPNLFRLLQQAAALSQETHGAFDITVAPLCHCWGFMNTTGRVPSPEEIACAKAVVGSEFIEFDENNFTIRFQREGMMLDMGAIAKGYALERSVEILLEGGIKSALIHGGTSTIYGIGTPPEQNSWKVAVEDSSSENAGAQNAPILKVVDLKDEALSVSAVWGKSFMADGQTYGHVIDPRTGQPVQDSLLAAVILPSAMETDALSTALLIVGAAGHEEIQKLRPGMRSILLARDDRDGPYTLRLRP